MLKAAVSREMQGKKGTLGLGGRERLSLPSALSGRGCCVQLGDVAGTGGSYPKTLREVKGNQSAFS